MLIGGEEEVAEVRNLQILLRILVGGSTGGASGGDGAGTASASISSSCLMSSYGKYEYDINDYY